MSMSYELYTAKLDKKLKDIRSKYMGQNKRLVEMVTGGEELPPRLLAERVAQILMLQIGQVRGLDEEDAGAGLRWLKVAMEYLLERYPKADHTFESLMMLVKLNNDVLRAMLEEEKEDERAQVMVDMPGYLAEHMEEAIWMLRDEEDKDWRRLEKKLGMP